MIIVLGYGICYLKITVDPVKLWSSPNSQCRQEREFFNSKFKPFFRTTQVIIVPKGLPNVNKNQSIIGHYTNNYIIITIIYISGGI